MSADGVEINGIKITMADIDDFQMFARTMWSPMETTGKDWSPLLVMSLGLSGEVGEAQEYIKKWVRDGKIDREALKKELGDVLYYWVRICDYFGFNGSEVIGANVSKLLDRKARGVLHGSGDNR